MTGKYQFRQIEPMKHLRYGSTPTNEENVKLKIVVPLLEAIGWDPVEDLFFEVGGADILVTDGGVRPLIVFETKNWSQLVTDAYLLQCADYLGATGACWAVLTSGSVTDVYTSLSLFQFADDRKTQTRPVARYEFSELGQRLNEVAGVLGKIAGLGGFTELKRLTLESHNLELWEAYEAKHDAFVNGYERRRVGENVSIGEDELQAAWSSLPTGRQHAIQTIAAGVRDLAGKWPEVLDLRTRKQSLHLGCFDAQAARTRRVGVLEIKKNGSLAFPVADLLDLINRTEGGSDLGRKDLWRGLSREPGTDDEAEAVIEEVRRILGLAGLIQ